MTSRYRLAVLILTAGSMLSTMPAFAHAKLVKSDPAPGSTIAAPKSIRLTFNEKVSPTFSGLAVSMGDGMTVKLASKVGGDGKTIVATPSGPFMSGHYKLAWHAAAVDDGHKTQGVYNFTVK